MDLLQPLLHLAQAGLSGYSLFHAYISVSNLHQYEQKMEKAAEWSDTAKHELHKTRTTQTSSALSILSSVIISLGLVSSPTPTITKVLLNTASIAICVLARTHISNFWANKAKVPLVKGFNAAITSTNVVKDHLGVLAISWIVSSVIEAWRLGNN
ncbi:hypothetical protein EG327_009320 [Venturia inaequalis]|uniref:Uncharacterized protein n=1 Tax=Venturia inaequalis TaxID=5025 RepID=A0A8H3ZHP3_VENIN|nr:hypothetical protein EG327_009320 [Venturia inaequalis]